MRKFILFFLLALFLGVASPVRAGKWSGVDETVVEHYAREYGREARTPYINTDQGDLLLFVFTLAGSIGGFIAGYNWRKLFSDRKDGEKLPTFVRPSGWKERPGRQADA